MAVFTWSDGLTPFVYSFDDTLPTIKDEVRSRIGDKDGKPLAYLTDNEITNIASELGGDLYATVAECAQICASRVFQLYEEVRQGNRMGGLQIKNFDPARVSLGFLKVADMYRDRSRPLSIPAYGSLSGRIREHRRHERPGRMDVT